MSRAPAPPRRSGGAHPFRSSRPITTAARPMAAAKRANIASARCRWILSRPIRGECFQTTGNVYDWVEDCYHGGYQGAPADGTAWTDGDCARRVLRGGSWYDSAIQLRAAARAAFYPGYRDAKIGFRVARPL